MPLFGTMTNPRPNKVTVAAVAVVLLFVFYLISSAFDSSPTWNDRDFEELAKLNEGPDKGEEVINGILVEKPLDRVIMFDVGSTGTRIHIYEFDPADPDAIPDEYFEQVSNSTSEKKIGIKTPEDVDDQLVPLLKQAQQKIPINAWQKTPVAVRCTAGLRRLEGTMPERILRRIEEVLNEYDFPRQRGPLGVSIMDGEDEAAYAWLTVNFLMGNLGEPSDNTVGVLDLGGASTQIAFATNDDVIDEVSPAFRTMPIGDQEYNLFVYSHLFYGLMEGRGSYIEADDDNKLTCLAADAEVEQYSLWGKEIDLSGAADASYEMCYADMDDLFSSEFVKNLHMAKTHDADYVKCVEHLKCCIGVPHPESATDHFVAMSYYFDRAVDLGIMNEEDGADDHSTLRVTPAMYKEKAQEICDKTFDDLTGGHPEDVDLDRVAFQCLDAAYIFGLLTEGLGFREDQQLSIKKKIKNLETGWSLGAAIAELSAYKKGMHNQ
eukprot:Clim_evm97s149 gene=Clim_evmTU97s149